jgi:eight-cysteine-cluster-containing protein
MKATPFILAILILLAAGCTQPPAPAENTTNQSNITAPPANQSNATAPPQNLTNGTNATIPVPPGYEVKDYCEKDMDCVRQKKCCDCGAGEYVNRYNLDDPSCTGPACACPIQESIGICRKNACVAVPVEVNQTANQSDVPFYFRALGQPYCGEPAAPVKNITQARTIMTGSINTSNPCYAVKAELAQNSSTYILNITTWPLETFAICTQCSGAIDWLADIRGYNDTVDVYYDNTLVYTDSNPFCGWSSGNCATDSDCRAGGCSGQVCESAGDPPTFTTCEWRSCYDAGSYALSCGCVNRKCRWK